MRRGFSDYLQPAFLNAEVSENVASVPEFLFTCAGSTGAVRQSLEQSVPELRDLFCEADH